MRFRRPISDRSHRRHSDRTAHLPSNPIRLVKMAPEPCHESKHAEDIDVSVSPSISEPSSSPSSAGEIFEMSRPLEKVSPGKHMPSPHHIPLTELRESLERAAKLEEIPTNYAASSPEADSYQELAIEAFNRDLEMSAGALPTVAPDGTSISPTITTPSPFSGSENSGARVARKIAQTSFEPPDHFYPRVLNAQIHPLVSSFFSLSNERIIALATSTSIRRSMQKRSATA